METLQPVRSFFCTHKSLNLIFLIFSKDKKKVGALFGYLENGKTKDGVCYLTF